MSKKNHIIMGAYPDRGVVNDPIFILLYFILFIYFFFLGGEGGGSLSPPRLKFFTVGNMGVMICLGQGGLRSLSASSFIFATCRQENQQSEIKDVTLPFFPNRFGQLQEVQ